MAFDLESFIPKIRKLPKPTQYKGWLSVVDQITVHTMGRPYRLLKKRRPGEPDDVFAYRSDIMKDITKGSINKAFDNLSRIFQNTSWTWRASTVLTDFLLNETFENSMSFKEYCEKVALRFDIDDPNGLLVWLPVLDADGNLDTVKPTLYPSRKIRYMDNDVVLILNETAEQSAKELGDKFNSGTKEYNNGYDYLLICKTGFYKVSLPKGQQSAITVEILFESEYESVPVIVLGGNRTVSGYNESFFQGFIAFGDEALMSFSDHQAVNVQFSYPVREEKGMTCDHPGCGGHGYLKNDKDNLCPRCKGSGVIRVRSPWGIYVTKESNILKDEEKSVSVPAVQFHSPDVGILDYSSGEWVKFLERAENAVHIVYIDEAQSGEAKKMDEKGQWALLQNIGGNYYGNIIPNSLWFIEQTINTNPVKPIVYKPVKYQTQDEQDPVDNIKNMIASGAPKHIITVAIEEFLQYQYNEANPIHKITAVLVQFDPFFAYMNTEKDRMLALGVIDKNEYRKSAIAYPVLKRISMAMGADFLTTPIDAIIKKLEAEMKPLLLQEVPVNIPTNADGTPQ